ncbi:hypothetical protein B0H16DRAFT_1688272, partial [Mycena metata]
MKFLTDSGTNEGRGSSSRFSSESIDHKLECLIYARCPALEDAEAGHDPTSYLGHKLLDTLSRCCHLEDTAWFPRITLLKVLGVRLHTLPFGPQRPSGDPPQKMLPSSQSAVIPSNPGMSQDTKIVVYQALIAMLQDACTMSTLPPSDVNSFQ